MRIGLSTSLVQQGRSTVGQYVLHLLAALLRHASEHEYVVFTSEDDLPVFEFARDRAKLVPVATAFNQPVQDLAWHQFALPRAVADHRVDVLHVPSERRMTWRQPCALVTSVHDLGVFATPRSRVSRGSCPGAVFRALARRQHQLVAPSEAAAEELRTLCGLPLDRVTAVPGGVDLVRFTTPPARDPAEGLLRKHGLHPPFFVCVIAAEEAPWQYRPLIRAFETFKTLQPSPWQLVFIAGGPPQGERMRAVALHSPYAPDIHCVEHISGAELPLWYRVAGALLQLSPTSGFALPALVAMACGCPILADDTPNTRELCGEGALYASWHDPAALQHRLSALANDVALGSAVRIAGKARAQDFSYARIAARMTEVYARAQLRTRPIAASTRPMTHAAP